MPTTSDQTSNTAAPIRFIVDEPGIDTELGIKGRGYSPDNGQTFVVEDTTDGRVYRLLDAKRLYPLLKPMFDQVYNSGPVETSLHWADILDKPDLITKQQLDDRLTAFTPAVSWDQVTGKPDLATQDDLKKIELTPGPPGKDGSPGSPGVTPHIDATTGNWFIGTTNTGVKAQGPAGQNGSDGKPGSNGSDGVSPHIDSATGHWFIGSTDTGVSARGPQGQQGSPGKDGVTPDVSKLATKTDLANYYTKTETDTKLSTKADQAEYQTLNDKFNNMQIGGRNLVQNTDQDTVIDDTANTGTNGWHFMVFNLTQQLKVGDQITVSAEGTLTGKGDLSGYTAVLYDNATTETRSESTTLISGKRSSVTLTVSNLNGTGDTVLLIYAGRYSDTEGKKNVIHHLKVEFGNVATDWTPAPEDTTAAIQKNTTAIDQANQQITDLQTAVKAQQSAAIDTSNVSTSKKPSDYSDGIFHEVKYISALGIDRSELDVTAQAGTQVFLTTKAYNSYARQTAEVFDSNRPITFIRNGYSSSWSTWEVVTTW